MSDRQRARQRVSALFFLTALVLGLIAGPEATLAQDESSSQDQNQPSPAQQQARDLWADFAHYVLVARPDLAAAAGQKLVDSTDPGVLLDAVEAGSYDDPGRIFDRAVKTDGVSDIAGRLRQKLEQARLDRSRDSERIANNIQLLGEGDRPYTNAVRRLSAAGQYAAPQLLQTLAGQDNARLHPYVLRAMVAVGQSISYPLAVALPDLDPVVQGQVARILAEIGYPRPLPYLKRLIEDDSADPTAQRAALAAYDRLIAQTNLNPNLSAAELFNRFGQQHYNAPNSGQNLVGYDPATGKGILWDYTRDTGLVPVPVPGPIYRDTLAMREAQTALDLDPQLNPALSLWLMANLRRENNLPQGEVDPSYGQDRKPASFYAMLAGPQRLQDVLAQALRDRDRALALDAIQALRQTAGTDALVNSQGNAQPLIQALSYPDRQVRFRAALAFAQARPDHGFDAAFRVVPVLAEAIRSTGAKYAVVLAQDQQTRNQLLSTLSGQGYDAIGGAQLGQLSSQIDNRPGIDLIAVDGSAQTVRQLVSATSNDYKLSATPILALTSTGDRIRLSGASSPSDRVTAIERGQQDDQLTPALKQITADSSAQMTQDQGDQAATDALATLRELALDTGDDVYQVSDAQPALISTLSDDRQPIAIAAARVLSLLDSSDAQRAIAQAALSSEGDKQIALLNALSESATYFGNQLQSSQTDQLVQLVQSSQGDTAVAAAQAHGALTLPTQSAVQLIVGSGPQQ